MSQSVSCGLRFLYAQGRACGAKSRVTARDFSAASGKRRVKIPVFRGLYVGPRFVSEIAPMLWVSGALCAIC
jgi:hypothetical protein